MTIADQIYELVSKIPSGKVLTYGLIAQELGLKTPRQVGWVLHRNPDHNKIPCHRVVFSDGKLSGQFAFGGRDAQKKWLASEGVLFKGERVDLQRCLWK
jgi:methylated-DNA-protein-cysteine methyltransferase-like protein